jgi:UDP-N-acetylmuramate dehydrogenase
MDSFATLTTFKLGGGIARVERPRSHETFIATLTRLAGKPFLILGGGSNVLAQDDDYEGVVVVPSFKEIRFDENIVTADAGASWDAVVEESVTRGLWGIENLSGIPGSVGGAIVANVGAYGAALSDTLVSVEVFDVVQGELRTLSLSECGASYRMTVFKKAPERFGILSATMRLSRETKPNVSYRDLAEWSKGQATIELSEVRDAVLAIRSRKFPPFAEYGTAGSFFLNPVLPEREAVAIRKRFPEIPLFPMPEGGVKVPLAWIIDHVLSLKGMREGGAFLWEAQPLVIATESGATAKDVRALAEKVSALVKEKTNIEIFPEVRVL